MSFVTTLQLLSGSVVYSPICSHHFMKKEKSLLEIIIKTSQYHLLVLIPLLSRTVGFYNIDNPNSF